MTEERRRLVLPDRRKQTYASLENKIDEHGQYCEDRLGRWIRKGLIAFAIIGLFSTGSLIGFGFVLHEVQGQRHEACLNQNGRHDRTLLLFRQAADKAIKENPKQAVAIRRNIRANEGIINALAPKQDCDKIAPVWNFFL